MKDYSTKRISNKLIEEVMQAIQNIRGWGSVEIFVQNDVVVQITERNIKKTQSSTNTTQSVKLGLDN